MALRVPLDAHAARDADERRGQGTQVAFEDLWRHRAALRDICQRIVGDGATADDVVQETYLRALRNLDTLEQRPSLMPWLATVARRRSIDELRRRRYQHPVDEMPDEGTKPEHDPGESAAVSETVEQVREALTSLTARERDLLMRQVNHGMTLAELAECEESTVASVRSVLSRARTKLREALAETGARTLAPLAALGAWMKRKTADLNVKVQQASPLVSGSYDRLGEVATASVTAAALALGGVLVPAGASGSDQSGVAVDTVETSSSDRAARAVDSNAADGAAREALEARAATTDTPTGESDEGAVPGPTSDGGTNPRAPIGPLGDTPTASPSAPPLPDDPTAEPDPERPDDTDFLSMSSASSTSSGAPFVAAIGESECQTGRCRVVWTSADGGSTWTKMNADGLEGDTILVPPRYGETDSRLFAIGDAGLQVSTDEGASWETVLGSSFSGPAAMSPGFEPGGDERIFLGAAPTWSYDASTDVARPSPLPGLPGGKATFAFTPNYATTGVVFAATTDPETFQATVYRCTDRCSPANAAPLPGDLAGVPKLHVSSDFADSGVVVAWADSRVFVSDDGGSTFDEVDLPSLGTIASIVDDGGGNFYVGGRSRGRSSSAVLRTSDFATFTPVGSDSSLAPGVTSIVAPTSSLLLASPNETSGGGVLCSTDRGVTWSSRC